MIKRVVFQWTDLRVAMLGNVDAGKSTLCGVLTHGELDNGAGSLEILLNYWTFSPLLSTYSNNLRIVIMKNVSFTIKKYQIYFA